MEIAPKNWTIKLGEKEGVFDKRIGLLEYRAQFTSLLETIDQDLDSAFPTIADTEIRPKLLRAIAIIDRLTSDETIESEERNALEQELEMLELELVRNMRAKFIQESNMKQGSDAKISGIFSGAPGASEDHFTVISDDWQSKPQ